MAELRQPQSRTAADLWGKDQTWLSRRVLGAVPFTAGELADLAEYLGVDVNDWIQASRTKELLHQAS